MKSAINAKELRASLPRVVAEVRRGARFTVIYRSRPAFVVMRELRLKEALTLLGQEP